MQSGEPGRAKRPVLFLRMLQDQKRYPACNRSDAVADAKRFRFEAPRTIRGGPRHIADFRDARHQLAIRFVKASTQPRRLLRAWWFTRRAPEMTVKERGFFQNINAQQPTKTVKILSTGMFRRYRKR